MPSPTSGDPKRSAAYSQDSNDICMAQRKYKWNQEEGMTFDASDAATNDWVQKKFGGGSIPH